ncbi:MAG: hypothetical protein R3F11_14930 [Verrucomicrobiales bacterium]
MIALLTRSGFSCRPLLAHAATKSAARRPGCTAAAADPASHPRQFPNRHP